MNPFQGKPVDQLLEKFNQMDVVGTPIEQLKATIQVGLVEQLTRSIARMTEDQIRLTGDLCRAIDAHKRATSLSSWLMAALTFGLVLASAVQVWRLLTN